MIIIYTATFAFSHIFQIRYRFYWFILFEIIRGRITIQTNRNGLLKKIFYQIINASICKRFFAEFLKRTKLPYHFDSWIIFYKMFRQFRITHKNQIFFIIYCSEPPRIIYTKRLYDRSIIYMIAFIIIRIPRARRAVIPFVLLFF